MKKRSLLLLLMCFLLSACAKSTGMELSLFPSYGESMVSRLTPKEVQSYLDDIVPQIQENPEFGVFNHELFANDELLDRNQYALYTGTKKYGEGFSIMLNILTVYDGNRESIGLTWLSNEAGVLENYEVVPYLWDDDETVEQNELIFVSGYTISIPKDEINEKSMIQSGYQLTSTGDYQISENFILIMDSTFSQ